MPKEKWVHRIFVIFWNVTATAQNFAIVKFLHCSCAAVNSYRQLTGDHYIANYGCPFKNELHIINSCNILLCHTTTQLLSCSFGRSWNWWHFVFRFSRTFDWWVWMFECSSQEVASRESRFGTRNASPIASASGSVDSHDSGIEVRGTTNEYHFDYSLRASYSTLRFKLLSWCVTVITTSQANELIASIYPLIDRTRFFLCKRTSCVCFYKCIIILYNHLLYYLPQFRNYK